MSNMVHLKGVHSFSNLTIRHISSVRNFSVELCVADLEDCVIDLIPFARLV